MPRIDRLLDGKQPMGWHKVLLVCRHLWPRHPATRSFSWVAVSASSLGTSPRRLILSTAQ